MFANKTRKRQINKIKIHNTHIHTHIHLYMDTYINSIREWVYNANIYMAFRWYLNNIKKC